MIAVVPDGVAARAKERAVAVVERPVELRDRNFRKSELREQAGDCILDSYSSSGLLKI
jgi:hypothetical protein